MVCLASGRTCVANSSSLALGFMMASRETNYITRISAVWGALGLEWYNIVFLCLLSILWGHGQPRWFEWQDALEGTCQLMAYIGAVVYWR